MLTRVGFGRCRHSSGYCPSSFRTSSVPLPLSGLAFSCRVLWFMWPSPCESSCSDPISKQMRTHAFLLNIGGPRFAFVGAAAATGGSVCASLLALADPLGSEPLRDVICLEVLFACQCAFPLCMQCVCGVQVNVGRPGRPSNFTITVSTGSLCRDLPSQRA